MQRRKQPPVEIAISYAGQWSDFLTPFYPYKSLALQASPKNCLNFQVYSDLEVKIDRAIVLR